MWRVGGVIVPPLFHLMFSIRFTGLEHVPRQGGALVAGNHLSPLDPIVMAMGTLRRGRPIRFLAAAEFMRHPLVGWFLRGLAQIPVRRGTRDRSALDAAAATLAERSLVGIFPEGRVGEGPGVGRGRSGVARIALSAGTPILPVGVWGLHRRWPRTGLHIGGPLRPGVGVAFGPPIPAPSEPPGPDAVRRLTDDVMREIVGLVERARALAVR